MDQRPPDATWAVKACHGETGADCTSSSSFVQTSCCYADSDETPLKRHQAMLSVDNNLCVISTHVLPKDAHQHMAIASTGVALLNRWRCSAAELPLQLNCAKQQTGSPPAAHHGAWGPGTDQNIATEQEAFAAATTAGVVRHNGAFWHPERRGPPLPVAASLESFLVELQTRKRKQDNLNTSYRAPKTHAKQPWAVTGAGRQQPPDGAAQAEAAALGQLLQSGHLPQLMQAWRPPPTAAAWCQTCSAAGGGRLPPWSDRRAAATVCAAGPTRGSAYGLPPGQQLQQTLLAAQQNLELPIVFTSEPDELADTACSVRAR